MQTDGQTAKFLDEVLQGKVNRRTALRRAAGLGLSAGAFTTMLAARATAVGAQEATPSPFASPGANPAASPAAAVPYEPQGPAVERLVFWTRASQDTGPAEWNALVAVTQAYTQAIGSQVELVTVPDPDFRSRLSLAAPSGEGPDVLGPIAHDWIGELAIQRIALPLAQDQIANVSDFTEATLRLVSVDGQIYAIPLFTEALALVHNTDLVPQAPATWEELVSTATQITNGEVYGFGFPLLEQYYEGPFFFGFGSYIFPYENGEFNTEDIGLNNEGAVQAATFLRDMFHQQQPPMPEAVIDRANMGPVIDGMFEAGQLGMTIAGPWREPTLTAAGIPYGVATLPTLPNGQPMTPFLGIQAVSANAYGQQIEASLDFINFMGSANGIQLMIEGLNRAPARQSAVPAAIAINPTLETWAAQAASANPMPNIPAMGQVWTPWGDTMDAIIPNNLPDEEVKPLLDQMVETIQANIQQAQS